MFVATKNLGELSEYFRFLLREYFVFHFAGCLCAQSFPLKRVSYSG